MGHQFNFRGFFFVLYLHVYVLLSPALYIRHNYFFISIEHSFKGCDCIAYSNLGFLNDTEINFADRIHKNQILLDLLGEFLS